MAAQLSLLADIPPFPEPVALPLPATKARVPKLPNAASQAERIAQLLSDGAEHRTDEIVRRCYRPGQALARVGARIYELRKRGMSIRGWHDSENPALYFYQLAPNGAEVGNV